MIKLRPTTLVLCALCVLLALPAVAGASDDTGGAAYAPNAFAAAPPDALLGGKIRFEGSAPAGRNVLIERFDAEEGWTAEQFVVADSDGRFVAKWRPTEAGRHRMRAVVHGDNARASSTTPELDVTVYRPANATWYGPGFYGRRTACGKRMSRRLLGVAHKKLKCGTKISLFYEGRTITVPVVDRGPFRKNTRWDLTIATAKALDFTHTDRIGAIRARR